MCVCVCACVCVCVNAVFDNLAMALANRGKPLKYTHVCVGGRGIDKDVLYLLLHKLLHQFSIVLSAVLGVVSGYALRTRTVYTGQHFATCDTTVQVDNMLLRKFRQIRPHPPALRGPVVSPLILENTYHQHS